MGRRPHGESPYSRPPVSMSYSEGRTENARLQSRFKPLRNLSYRGVDLSVPNRTLGARRENVLSSFELMVWQIVLHNQSGGGVQDS
jgi:hypothetical protein